MPNPRKFITKFGISLSKLKSDAYKVNKIQKSFRTKRNTSLPIMIVKIVRSPTMDKAEMTSLKNIVEDACEINDNKSANKNNGVPSKNESISEFSDSNS